jgi:uncharacterized protein YlxW (UPF0749 family)
MRICRYCALLLTILLPACAGSRKEEIVALTKEQESYKHRHIIASEKHAKLDLEVKRLNEKITSASPESLATTLKALEDELRPIEAEVSALQAEFSAIETFTATTKERLGP